jgi:hypothetical protein
VITIGTRRIKALGGVLHRFGEQLLDDLLHFERRRVRAKARHRHALTIANELAEIPLDRRAQRAGETRTQETVDGVGLGSVDGDLVEQRILGSVVQRELLDFGVGFWLLHAKLIAWKRQDCEALLRVTVVENGELLVILGGQASVRRNVDDDAHFASVLRQRMRVLVDVQRSELENRLGGRLDRRLLERGAGVEQQLHPLLLLFRRRRLKVKVGAIGRRQREVAASAAVGDLEAVVAQIEHVARLRLELVVKAEQLRVGDLQQVETLLPTKKALLLQMAALGVAARSQRRRSVTLVGLCCRRGQCKTTTITICIHCHRNESETALANQ